MASIIRVKRSTGTVAPGTLNYGEVAYTIGAGTQGNRGQRLFVGDNSSNPQLIGGEYYTDLLNNTPGTVEGGANTGNVTNGFVPILDRSASGNPGGGGNVNNLPRVNQWSVDNLTIDANTISSNDNNGHIWLRTNGTGEVIIPDDQFLTFGDNRDGKIEYDENGSDSIQVTGAKWKFNVPVEFQSSGGGGGYTFDNIGISSNVISTRSGGGNTLYIDPYPDGLDSDGLVIVKGSLQVDGTTTTVNSTNATLNDAIMHLGDVTSKVTVVNSNVGSGTSAITVDSIIGINTGDTLTATGLPGAGTTTVHSYVTAAGISTVYIDGVTTAGINTTSQITVTHAYDTNTDRGLSFAYNTSSGSGNNKTGFFGYIDEGGVSANGGNTNVPVRSWTYIPDATVTSNTAEGVRGFLDIKGIYYQGASGGDWSSSGAIYFDSTGKMTSTGTPASGITTSNYVLTTNASGIPVWTTTIDGGTF